jgi:hypothetical protein
MNGRPIFVFLWVVLLYAGLACSFAMLPVLILQVVPPDMRGQSTGVNLIIRTVGSAIGLQFAASLVAASRTGASGVPTEPGFAHAFGMEAAGAVAALLLCMLLPRMRSGSVELPSEHETAPAPSTQPSEHEAAPPAPSTA